MPPIQPIKIMADVTFMSKMYKLPIKFKKPQGDPKGKHYGDAFKLLDRIAIPKLIPPWFFPAEIPNKYYQDSCDTIGGNYKDFAYAMLDAVAFSHTMWKLQAKFKDLQVMALSAIGSPGCLDGPELESNIKNAPMCASFSGNMAKH